MINLFRNYEVASDKKIVRYIKTNRYQYENEYNITGDKLMTSNLNTYYIIIKDNK